MSTGAVRVSLGGSSLIRSQALNQGFMHRILFITYEHAIRTFSGNGVYATSQTSALTGLGHHVVVLSAYPDDFELRNDANNAIRVRFLQHSRTMSSVFHAMCCAPCSTGCVCRCQCPAHLGARCTTPAHGKRSRMVLLATACYSGLLIRPLARWTSTWFVRLTGMLHSLGSGCSNPSSRQASSGSLSGCS